MRVARPFLRRVLLFALSHLVIALLLFFLALYVTEREFERAVTFSWSDFLFWLSIVLLEPARSIVDSVNPPEPLAVSIFLVNSLGWGYGVAAAVTLWTRMRGRRGSRDRVATLTRRFAPPSPASGRGR